MAELSQEQIDFITDDTCKYGHMCGWSEENNCYKCSTCGSLIGVDIGENEPPLITHI